MKAMEGRYAIPAYNFNNLAQHQVIMMGCSKSRSPVIGQCSGSAINT
ncbi:MAG: class II fructose-bisphosphate aldolase [Desulfomonilaceae bacterium]